MAIDIWGRVVADDSDYNIAQAEKAARVKAAVAAHLRQHQPGESGASADLVERADNATAPCSPSRAPSSHREVERARLVTSVDPVKALDAAVNAAVDDVARAGLLATAPKPVREQLVALWGYKAFMKDECDVYGEFEHALGAAANDADRAALIAGRTPAFLVEWAWRTRATSDDWRRRYLALVDGSDPA